MKTVCGYCHKIGHLERVCPGKKRAKTNTHATYTDELKELPKGDETIFQTAPSSTSHLPFVPFVYRLITI